MKLEIDISERDVFAAEKYLDRRADEIGSGVMVNWIDHVASAIVESLKVKGE